MILILIHKNVYGICFKNLEQKLYLRSNFIQIEVLKLFQKGVTANKVKRSELYLKFQDDKIFIFYF